MKAGSAASNVSARLFAGAAVALDAAGHSDDDDQAGVGVSTTFLSDYYQCCMSAMIAAGSMHRLDLNAGLASVGHESEADDRFLDYRGLREPPCSSIKAARLILVKNLVRFAALPLRSPRDAGNRLQFGYLAEPRICIGRGVPKSHKLTETKPLQYLRSKRNVFQCQCSHQPPDNIPMDHLRPSTSSGTLQERTFTSGGLKRAGTTRSAIGCPLQGNLSRVVSRSETRSPLTSNGTKRGRQ